VPFLSDCYDVGIIPCTSQKWPDGKTPMSLYRGPPFNAMVLHAQQRCKEILFLSAKHGLIRANEPIDWYDVYLPNLSDKERAVLIEQIRAKPWVELYAGKRILSYLPKAYFELLAEAKPALCATMRRPYKRLGNLQTIQILRAETKNYGKNPAMR